MDPPRRFLSCYKCWIYLTEDRLFTILKFCMHHLCNTFAVLCNFRDLPWTSYLIFCYILTLLPFIACIDNGCVQNPFQDICHNLGCPLMGDQMEKEKRIDIQGMKNKKILKPKESKCSIWGDSILRQVTFSKIIFYFQE